MRVELGINNCFAVKRWPEPDEWADIVRSELGLELVQHSLDLLPLDGGPPGDVEAAAEPVARACGARGLRVASVFTGLRDYSTNMMLGPDPGQRDRGGGYWEWAIDLAAALGADTVGGHVGSLSRRDADDPDRRAALWQELAGRLQTLAARAQRGGVAALLVENMACDREPWRMADVAALLREPDAEHAAVALCLDVGHQCAPAATGDDADPYAWLSALGARTAIVHLQQSDAEADHHWPFTPEYNARGRIRADRTLAALAASGTDRATLMLEVIPAFEADDGRVLDDLRQSVAYWRQALDEHEHD